jgi:hypothetical protein
LFSSTFVEVYWSELYPACFFLQNQVADMEGRVLSTGLGEFEAPRGICDMSLKGRVEMLWNVSSIG